jgi:hypothetical protein
MICDMIRPEGMRRSEGTGMQTKPDTDMICDMIRPGNGHNRPEMTKRTWPRAASRRGFAMKAPSYRRDATLPLYSACLRLYLLCTTTGVFAFFALHSLFVLRR